MSSSGSGFGGAGLCAVRSDLAATSRTISATLGRVVLAEFLVYGFSTSGVTSLSLWGGLVTQVDLHAGTEVTFVTMV